MMRRHLPEIVLWAALLTVPLWLNYVGGYSALGSKILVYGIAALALNLVLGFTGGLSFGHAAYFGLGAYGAGMTLKYLAASTPLAILIGTLAGGLAATLLGPLVMRRRGIYFAMITIAIGQLFYFVAVRWNNVTGGEDGLAGFQRQPLHFGSLVYDAQNESKYYYLVLLCFAVAVVIMIVLGGMRKFWGPLVGVTIFVVAQDYLSSLLDNWMTAIGMLFVLIVLVFPKGILGLVGRRGRDLAGAVTGRRAAIERSTATIEPPPAPLKQGTK